MFRNFKVLMIALVAIIVAGSAFAFAAANTGIPAGKAGTGSATVSGYIVSLVDYVFNASDPSNLDAVTFTLDGVATMAKIQVDSLAGDWYACTDLDGAAANNAWSCATTSPQVTTAAFDTLVIVASDR